MFRRASGLKIDLLPGYYGHGRGTRTLSFLALACRGRLAFCFGSNKKTFVSVILAFGFRVVGCLACCGFFLSNTLLILGIDTIL